MTLRTVIFSAVAAIAIGAAGFVTIDKLMVPEAHAQTSNAKRIIDMAKAKGLVGETLAGYLALVDGSASPEIVNAMNEINIRRKSLYTRKAREQNVQIEVVAALTGEKVVGDARPGEKVMKKAGVWETVR